MKLGLNLNTNRKITIKPAFKGRLAGTNIPSKEEIKIGELTRENNKLKENNKELKQENMNLKYANLYLRVTLNKKISESK